MINIKNYFYNLFFSKITCEEAIILYKKSLQKGEILDLESLLKKVKRKHRKIAKEILKNLEVTLYAKIAIKKLINEYKERNINNKEMIDNANDKQ